jgi:hypothetical protein
MKVCDKCRSDKAKTYKYADKWRGWVFSDLCTNCLQTVVLETQSRLIEVTDEINGKGLING